MTLRSRPGALVLLASALLAPAVHAQGTEDAGTVLALDGGLVAHPIAPDDAGTREGDAGLAAAAQAASEAEEPPLPAAHRPRLSLRLEPGPAIRTGEILTVHIVAELPDGDDVTIPSQSFAPLELHARRVTDTVRDGRRTRHFVLELLALEPGSIAVESIQLQVVTADGQVGTVRTESVPLEVRSVLGNEPNARPHDPTRPRVMMEEDPRPLYAIYAGVAMLAGAILALLVRRWWRSRPKPVIPPPPPRPAWELAFERLETLRRDGPAMIEEGRVGPWIDSLSDTVREYLGKRYGFEGLECTSDEVIARIETLRIRSLAAGELQVFLGECDLVKFAQASMTPEQAESMYRQAYRLVNATVPHGQGFVAVSPTGQGGAS